MHTASCCTYFMKALYHRLPVAIRKHLYDRRYPSVVCLFCGDVEISDHVFSCPQDAVGRAHLSGTHASAWEAFSGLSCSFSCVLQALASCVSEVEIGVALCKGFVFDKWFYESVLVFNDSNEGTKRIVGFVFTPVSVSGLSKVFLAGVVRLLGVAKAFGVGFGFRRFCLFFSGIGNLVFVHIDV
ncbi:hypothetical protein G9A89_013468 [Geosiphon pyriformis]|nr:hypothetical protein G9A89_013468 [Geosiphon pyriformis]